VITVLVVTLAFYGAHRLRATLEPVVVIGAAAYLASTSPVMRLAERTTIRWRGAGS
jgi:hypothetical protein